MEVRQQRSVLLRVVVAIVAVAVAALARAALTPVWGQFDRAFHSVFSGSGIRRLVRQIKCCPRGDYPRDSGCQLPVS